MVTFAPSKIAPTAMATRGRPRTNAITPTTGAQSTYLCGSHNHTNRLVAVWTVPWRCRSMNPKNVVRFASRTMPTWNAANHVATSSTTHAVAPARAHFARISIDSG